MPPWLTFAKSSLYINDISEGSFRQAIPDFVALFALSGTVEKLTKEYFTEHNNKNFRGCRMNCSRGFYTDSQLKTLIRRIGVLDMIIKY